MNMRGGGEGNINQYLADTIASVFDSVYTVDVGGTTNRELFAMDHGDALERLAGHSASLADGSLSAMMERVQKDLTAYEAGDYIMTDDKAPVELLGMRVIDELIRDEVAYYKDIYEQQGISGVLESLN